MGLSNFYLVFLKDKAEPLHQLLHKGVPFIWGQTKKNDFENLKNIIASEPILGHCDEKIKLTCDASPYGVGCVLVSYLNQMKID